MTAKNGRMLRIDTDVLEELKKLKREMENLENRDLSMGEIIKRTIKSDEIKERLRIGSKERRDLRL